MSVRKHWGSGPVGRCLPQAEISIFPAAGHWRGFQVIPTSSLRQKFNRTPGYHCP